MDSVASPIAPGIPSVSAITSSQAILQPEDKSPPCNRLAWFPIGKRTERKQSARSKASRRKPHAGVDFPRWALRGFLDLSNGHGGGRCGKGGVVRVANGTRKLAGWSWSGRCDCVNRVAALRMEMIIFLRARFCLRMRLLFDSEVHMLSGAHEAWVGMGSCSLGVLVHGGQGFALAALLLSVQWSREILRHSKHLLFSQGCISILRLPETRCSVERYLLPPSRFILFKKDNWTCSSWSLEHRAEPARRIMPRSCTNNQSSCTPTRTYIISFIARELSSRISSRPLITAHIPRHCQP